MTTPDPAADLRIAVTVARQYLAEAEQADIHDHAEMIWSHKTLTGQLRRLLAVIDAQPGGEQP